MNGLVEMDVKRLQKKIDGYVKAKDFEVALRFVRVYGPIVKGFNMAKAEQAIMEEQAKKPEPGPKAKE